MIILPKNIFSLKDWKNANILNNFLVWYLDFEREDEERDEILFKAFEDYMSWESLPRSVRNEEKRQRKNRA